MSKFSHLEKVYIDFKARILWALFRDVGNTMTRKSFSSVYNASLFADKKN